MPDPRVVALADDLDARVMVFIDGQNLYNTCRRLFGHPLCHPHLLAHELAGRRINHRVATRFYTGRPNPNIPGEDTRARNLDRRLAAMSGVGVTVVTRQLRYHWDWGHRDPLPDPASGGPDLTVTLRPWQRPQEKGIDLAIGLDTVEFVLDGSCDVAIIVSLDRDLAEIPRAIRSLGRLIRRPVRLEAAVPVSGSDARPKTLAGFDYTHQITPQLFDRCRDEIDYTVPDRAWQPPMLPRP